MSGLEILKSVQFVVDQHGRPAAVQISVSDWESLLDWLEDVEDRALVREARLRLQAGPDRAGTLKWEEVSGEWDRDDRAPEAGRGTLRDPT